MYSIVPHRAGQSFIDKQKEQHNSRPDESDCDILKAEAENQQQGGEGEGRSDSTL